MSQITTEDIDAVIRAANNKANGRALIDMLLDLRIKLTNK
jgi:hypothetical protein